MGIRKPALSVSEARRLADIRISGSERAINPNVKNLGPEKVGSTTIASNSDTGGKARPANMNRVGTVTHVKKDKETGTPKKAADGRPSTVTREPVEFHNDDEAEEPKIQIYISALYPKPGHSPTYDFVSLRYPPKKALQMVLRRAVQDYEAHLESVQFQTLPVDYPVDRTKGGAYVSTSKMMPVSLFTRAKAYFDPTGLESERAFGRKLATAALAAFFAKEPRRHL